MVQSGSESVLFVGSQVPNLEWLMDYGLRTGCVVRGPAWQRVGAYLRVRATVLGDGSTVALRIMPELSGPVAGTTEFVRFANVATEVTVKNGQTVELAGTGENKDFYSRFLIGVDKSGFSRQIRISATPMILE
jgi:type II secretory pathway component GspD/PulD (secretin)